MRDPLIVLAEETGETLFAVEETRLGAVTRDAAHSPPSAVAIIGLQGLLTPKGLSFFGRQITPGLGNFRSALGQAAGNPDIAAIVIDTDSPGGTVAGTPETAAAVRAAAAIKPVIAMVDTIAASAAYWSISGATEIVATPSAELGSIGVMKMHLDHSKALEMEGVTATLIKAGKFKNDTFGPLTDEARAAIQAQVDSAYDDFVKAVASGRGVSPNEVRNGFGEGRMVLAKDARAMGMIDRIATMQEVLAGLMKPRSRPQRRAAFVF
ncbi:MAG: S49 family peptidase [Caulobacter sp.]|nr:S49 family peptidase [Caulobacter sp.]